MRAPRPAGCARARRAAALRTGGDSDTTRRAGRGARRSRCVRASVSSVSADRVVWSTASQSGPDMRSRTEVRMRNSASAAGSRDRSSTRKYSATYRSSPAKPSAPATSGAPARNDNAARYKPAGQPSVRSVNSESALSSSSTPAASSSNPASRSSNRRSVTPNSCTRPWARQRPTGRGGASLLATAICEPAGT